MNDPFAFYRALRPHYAQSFILESAPTNASLAGVGNEAGPGRMAEFTFLGFNPVVTVAANGDRFTVNGAGQGGANDLFPFLRAALREHEVHDAPAVKYLGGWVGSVGYDFIANLEPVPRPDTPHPFPDVALGLYLDGFVVDHRAGRAYYFTHHDDRCQDFLKLYDPDSDVEIAPYQCGPLRCAFERAGFERAVAQAQEAIRQGEAYQIVLSRQLEGEFSGDPLDGYRRLRALNPSPYMYFLDFGQSAIAGSSPEMLVSVQNNLLKTFPIAGTRPLGASEQETRALADELLADEKERAEHVMLVDLARNDIGRVAQVGSVLVSQYMTVERFSHVQHIVSCVQGALKKGLDGFDALASVFPAGTVSGAPKVRAMQLINQWEPVARGPYAGVVGYWSLNGNSDTAIAIRTAFFQRQKVYLQAGAGIVADSVPAKEFDETEHKLGAIRQVFGDAAQKLAPSAAQGGGA